MEVGTPDRWDLKAPEGLLDTIPLDWAFSGEDLERIRWGYVPRSMDERWFAYVKDDELHLHRSWTGLHFFTLRLTSTGIDQIRMARSQSDQSSDIAMVRWIVEALLVGRDWPFLS